MWVVVVVVLKGVKVGKGVEVVLVVWGAGNPGGPLLLVGREKGRGDYSEIDGSMVTGFADSFDGIPGSVGGDGKLLVKGRG